MRTIKIGYKIRYKGHNFSKVKVEFIDVESDSNEKELDEQIKYYFWKYGSTSEIIDFISYEILNKE